MQFKCMLIAFQMQFKFISNAFPMHFHCVSNTSDTFPIHFQCIGASQGTANSIFFREPYTYYHIHTYNISYIFPRYIIYINIHKYTYIYINIHKYTYKYTYQIHMGPGRAQARTQKWRLEALGPRA